MSIWRAVLAATVTAMAGFVGGIWFIGSGWGFQLIRPPAVPPPSPSSVPGLAARPAPPPRPAAKAVGVPAPWILAGGWSGLRQVAERNDLPPSPGCRWEVEPRELSLADGWSKQNPERLLIGVPSIQPRTGKLRYSLTQLVRPGKPAFKLRIVLFDAAGNRHRSRIIGSSTSGRAGEAQESAQHEWEELPPADKLGPLPFGVEEVVPDADRLLAEAARAEAAARKIELLPPPRPGEPFAFDLATVDGQRVRSADFRGKALLVILWGPFPRGPMNLGLIRKEFAPADLAVVGVSFSGDAAEAARDFERLGEPVPLVLVPNDVTTRRLWREGAEVAHLPTYWVVDRDGVLRHQGQLFDLSDKIATTLGRPTRRGKHEAFAAAAKAQADALKKLHGGKFPPNTVILNGTVYQAKPPTPGLGTPEHPMPLEPLLAPQPATGKP